MRSALGLALMFGVAVAAGAAEAPAMPAAAAGRHAQRAAAVDRVRLMAKELDLDEAQQTKLKAILETQRTDMLKVWSDESLPAPVRIGAARGVIEKTAERIRAMLTDEQREKYIKAHGQEAPAGKTS